MDRDRSRPRTGSSKASRGDSEALWDWNLESDRIHFSPRWVALGGCEDHEVGSVPGDWFQRVHPDDREQLRREIEAAQAGETTTFACRYRLRHKDGTYRWLSCRGTVVRDNQGRAIRLTGADTDVTVAVVTDPITRLPNRLLLMDRLAHSLDRARRFKGFHFALLAIDLGSPTGPGQSAALTDPTLTAVARRLETCLRMPEIPTLRNNDLVARVDGHLFAILLDGLKDIGHAKIAADRILTELLNPFTIGGREVRLTASIGIALSATGYTSPDEVLNDAETAVHRARVLGGSHCEVFDTAILESEQTELQLEGELEGALQRREFELFYQPIVSLVSNEILGFESLVRWRHPVLGMIAPLDFISIAERTGFIVPLGAWILREACRQLGEWHRTLPERTDLSVSVNVASAQWSDPTLIDQIHHALRDSGLDPRRLVLELTEGIAIANPTAVATLLMQLRAMGVGISVDDFGTGYSSLAYLRQFPIDTLKIDRSFVRGMVTNRDTAEIVAGIVNLSKQLGLRVVAEGIEHEDQCAPLRALNCDAGQGNLFAAPLDVASATEALKTGLVPLPGQGAEMPLPDREIPDARERVAGAPRLITRRVASMALTAVALVTLAGLMAVVNDVRWAFGAPVTPSADVTLKSIATTPAEPAAQPVPTEQIVARSAATSAPPAPRLPAPAAGARTTSLQVVHLHRFGECRGRLEVNRDGVAFVSEHEDAGDAFTLTFAEVLHALSDDTLTLRSATRTYRFKAAGPEGDGTGKLRDLASHISRVRR
jgi:diguanylate cyclase (GGDEF)-like protein/PAS domain S-box-containing protein